MTFVRDATPILPDGSPGSCKAVTLSVVEDGRITHLGAVIIWGETQAIADARAEAILRTVNQAEVKS